MLRNLLFFLLLSPVAVLGSSHREAPAITKYPQSDASDFYLFKSYEPGREQFVTLIANYIPAQAAYAGPNYFPLDERALYEILIDNDGDAIEDLTFQFRFNNNLGTSGSAVSFDIDGTQVTSVLRNVGSISTAQEAGLSHTQTFSLSVVDGPRRDGSVQQVTHLTTGDSTFRVPFDYAGTKTFGGPGNYGNYADSFIQDISLPGCSHPGRVFVGQRHDAFKLALGEIFDLVNFVPIEGDSSPGAKDGGGFPGGITQDENRNALARNNVTSLALEIHQDCVAGNEGIIGAWTASSLRQATILNPAATFDKAEVAGGAWTQVSRLSSPLVNELVIGYDQKDRFNASHPSDDGQFLTFVSNPVLPAILNVLFRDAVNATLGANLDDLAPSNFPRSDLIAAFLTGFEGVNKFSDATPGEMLRLNVTIPATPRNSQSEFGVAGGDLAGFPNGRRPGDDAVDIALRVVMGALCHDLPIGEGGTAANLGICIPDDAPVGDASFTDGAPLTARDLNNRFPYLLTPYPGSPTDAPLPQPE